MESLVATCRRLADYHGMTDQRYIKSEMMGAMKDFLITIRNGGDEAVAAVQRLGDDWRAMLDQAATEVQQARLTLTDEERRAVVYAITDLAWPPDGPQLAVVARTLGPSCEVPEHRMKATLRGLLERTRTT